MVSSQQRSAFSLGHLCDHDRYKTPLVRLADVVVSRLASLFIVVVVVVIVSVPGSLDVNVAITGLICFRSVQISIIAVVFVMMVGWVVALA